MEAGNGFKCPWEITKAAFDSFLPSAVFFMCENALLPA
jgi:hypothetical protein